MRWPARLRRPLLTALVLATLATLAFAAFQRRLSGAWPRLDVPDEALEHLAASIEDQRLLAELDGDNTATYRQRSQEINTLSGRLQILARSRGELTRSYDLTLLGVFVITLAGVGALWVLRQGRLEGRLEHLGNALEQLAAGRTDLELGESGGGTLGQVARMIERTSRVMASDRRRLRSLRNLSAWQEAARRHAHEMRTPLTAARLELIRLQELAEQDTGERGTEARRAVSSVLQELNRLVRFTEHFTSFARLPEPQTQRVDLGALVEEFSTTFAAAWPNLELQFESQDDLPESGSFTVEADRDMLRQVLVNLCDNSSQSLGQDSGRVQLRLSHGPSDSIYLELGDNGPGVDPAVREDLFAPYTTTRGIGEGMGLGLAICKKIQLDHGGDLELLDSSATGTTFRLRFPPPPSASDQAAS